MKSKNIVFPQNNRIMLETTDVPAVGKTQVLCRAEVSLVSIGTELRCLRGISDPDTNWNAWVQYPFQPGYSMTGTVLEVGAEVKAFQPGDRIVTQNPHSQYFLAEESDVNLMLIPDGISFEEAAWQPLGCITQLGARRAEISLGDDVAIVGLGMLGQLVTQYLSHMGVHSLLAIDMNPYRLKFAKRNGASHIFEGKSSDARAMVQEMTGGRKLDVVYDITGLPQTLSTVTPLVHRGGRVVLLGDNTQPSLQNLGPNVLSDSLNILGIHGSMCPDQTSDFARWSWREMARLFFDLILDGRMNVKDMNTDIFSPEEAEKVYLWLQNDRPDTFGVLFDWRKLG